MLHFESTGVGPLLILLHPVGLDHTSWGGFVAACAATHRVVAIDLRGHGASPPAGDGRSMSSYVDDVDQVLRGLEATEVSVVGLSFGGMIAQHLAIRRPELVRRMVLGACGAQIPDGMRDFVRARGDAALDRGMEGVLDETLKRWFTPAFMDDPAVAGVRNRLLQDSPADWNAAWQAIAGHDALEGLSGVRAPTLVLVGDRDMGTPIPVAASLAEAIPGSRFQVLDGAPHMLQIECPERFAAAAVPFVTGAA